MDSGLILEQVLNYIEDHLHEKLKTDKLAEYIGISVVHLQRIFKFSFNTTLADYIRKRKLSSSLSELMDRNFTVLDVALSYGFEHEQSYARAFRTEYAISPGEYKRTTPVLGVTVPIQLFQENKLEQGFMFGPEVVMMPAITLTGIMQKIPYHNARKLAPMAALDFWDKHKDKIINEKDNHTFYGLTHHLGNGYKYTNYLTAIETDEQSSLPEGMIKEVFGGCLCVRFHYIGNHHYREISQGTACQMYQAIEKFIRLDNKFTINKNIHLEKIDALNYHEDICLMEWFSPVILK